LRRGEAFLKAGADILFIEAPCSEGEMEKIAQTFNGTPLLANLVEDGKTPMLPPATLEQMGYKIALYPISALLSAAAAYEKIYADLLRQTGAARERVTFSQYNDIVGLPDLLATAKKYAPR
jgi:2-methylisocitrate lyase-like PEP mutase family enzyme